MKIDEPKTPYQADTEEVLNSEGCEDKVMVQDPDLAKVEEEVKKHLEEAERNKLLNA